MKNIKQYLIESKRVIYNDEGKKVPAICPECGGKVVLVLRGEPVYICSKCEKYFGTMPFKK
jgi:DNA-directed RNA polymerase subunit RPC12/RpoP